MDQNLISKVQLAVQLYGGGIGSPTKQAPGADANEGGRSVKGMKVPKA